MITVYIASNILIKAALINSAANGIEMFFFARWRYELGLSPVVEHKE